MAPSGLDESEKRHVRAAVRGAAATFPWYAALLDKHRATAARDELAIPLVSDADLAPTYYAAAERARGRRYVTSGTATGVPKRVWWPAADHRKYVDQRSHLISTFSSSSCATACADLGTGHAADSALEIFARAGLRGAQIDVQSPIEDHVEMLRRTRPDLLFTMPMILERILAAGGPGYVPRRVAVVGDLAPTEWRHAMAERLGMDPGHVLDVFGSIELGAIAYSDEESGGYLFHRHIVPEVLDATGAPANTGTLVVTSLARSGFPAVRYVSGDLVAGFRRVHTKLGEVWGYERHLGRQGSEIKHGEMLSVHAVAVALSRAAPGVAWEIRRAGLEVVIGIDRRGFSTATAGAVRIAIRNAHPSVDQMIRSGLVGDIRVEPVSFSRTATKRRMPSGLA